MKKKLFEGSKWLELKKPITHVLASCDGTGSFEIGYNNQEEQIMILSGFAETGAFKEVPDERKVKRK